MVGAKQVLINIKGNEADFKRSMTSASTSMKAFGATTAASSAVVSTGMSSVAATGTAAATSTSLLAASSAALGTTTVTVDGELANLNKRLASNTKFVDKNGKAIDSNHRSIQQLKGSMDPAIFNKLTKAVDGSHSALTRHKVITKSAGNSALVMAGKIKAAAITSVKSMLSMAAAAAPLAILVGTIAALGLAFKTAIAGAAEDQKTTMKTIALLKVQGVAWESVSVDVNNYIENLERLTLFSDTELQTSFNEFIVSGMNVEQALKATSAAAALANGTELTLKTSTTMLGKEFNENTSRLKNFGIEADNFDDILKQVNETVGDGSHVTETLDGKWKALKIEFTDQLKIVGNDLLPVFHDLFNTLVILTPVISTITRAIRILLTPITLAVGIVKMLILELQALWALVNKDTEGFKKYMQEAATALHDTVEQINAATYNYELLNTEASKHGNQLKENLQTQEELTAETEKTAAAAAADWRGSQPSAAARMGALGTTMSASVAKMLYGEDIPGSVTIAPTSGIGAIHDKPNSQSVTVNITTGDIVDQGGMETFKENVTSATIGSRSGV